jgi:hypothetical protein
MNADWLVSGRWKEHEESMCEVNSENVSNEQKLRRKKFCYTFQEWLCKNKFGGGGGPRWEL